MLTATGTVRVTVVPAMLGSPARLAALAVVVFSTLMSAATRLGTPVCAGNWMVIVSLPDTRAPAAPTAKATS